MKMLPLFATRFHRESVFAQTWMQNQIAIMEALRENRHFNWI